ncbi:hypothetical protein M4D51_13060 [Microbacterium sp. p3-SID338]|uniref:hypothetical protein n=1 Tax=Microbacterium sp. p3-SID338 TaxID=2916214 RepID=UPI0021A39507|nr:hypothetical protein [Microbacterium sp. p3-SID338]MCT1396654.1 hypothetical protein [Microbacterium sp. p3-SID338]
MSEYEIVFGGVAAERGWRDLKATAKNALADAWDYLTVHPTQFDSSRCYQLKGNLATVVVDGKVLPVWQYKVTDGARLRYAVDEPNPKTKKQGRVILLEASPSHPNDTDPSKNFR